MRSISGTRRYVQAFHQLEKVADYAEIMRWPILATPGLVVNETLVASGRIPSEAEIAGWLTA